MPILRELSPGLCSTIGLGVSDSCGSGLMIARRELMGKTGAEFGRPEPVRPRARPKPAGKPPRLIADAGRLRGGVDWTPYYDPDSSLGDTITYWREALAAPGFDR